VPVPRAKETRLIKVALRSPRWAPAIALLLGLLMAAALGEGVTRLFAHRLFNLSNPLYRFDAEVGWVYKDGPILVRQNEEGESIALEGSGEGLRKPEASGEGGGVTLAVGDSFTSGTQLPLGKAWPARLEGALALPGHRVVNAGVDGYDLAQEYRLAARLWDHYHPELLVVGLYVGNDIVDYDTAAQALPPWSGAPRVLLERSFLFHFITGSMNVIEQRTRRTRWLGPLPSWDPRVLPGFENLTLAEADRVRAQFASPELIPVLRGGQRSRHRLESTERVVRALASLASAHKARFALVLIPTKQQILPIERAAWLQVLRLHADVADLPQKALVSWAESADIPLVDLEPGFREDEDPPSLYWKIDMHLTARGHEKAANSIAPFLRTLLTSR
jgi:lysophospholipase L1-like esterase